MTYKRSILKMGTLKLDVQDSQMVYVGESNSVQ